jgi:hypothetical protein
MNPAFPSLFRSLAFGSSVLLLPVALQATVTSTSVRRAMLPSGLRWNRAMPRHGTEKAGVKRKP